MTISVLEWSNVGKTGNPDGCEDMYVATDDFVAVIDGATNITGRLMEGKAPGRIAAETIQQCLMEVPPDITLHALLDKINSRLKEVCADLGLSQEIKHRAWLTPTACMIVYSRHHQEIWQIGDCQCMIDGLLYLNEKQIDYITANARALYLEAELKKGKTIDELRENDTGNDYIRTLVQLQYFLQNDQDNQFGFEVINGSGVDFNRVKKISVHPDVETIILASDGYPVLKETLAETEEELTRLLLSDPLCFREFKSTKGLKKGNSSFDDRTYIRFTI